MNRFSCVVLNWRTLLLPTIGSAASIVSLARTASSHAYKELAERKMRCRDGPQSTLTENLNVLIDLLPNSPAVHQVGIAIRAAIRKRSLRRPHNPILCNGRYLNQLVCPRPAL